MFWIYVIHYRLGGYPGPYEINIIFIPNSWDNHYFLLITKNSFKKMNTLEMASDMAEEKVKEEFPNPYTQGPNGDWRFTEEAQDLFNFWYEIYLDELTCAD